MPITTAQQQELLKLGVGTINASLGGYIGDLAAALSAGATIPQIYESVANNAAFKALNFANSDASTNGQFATYYANQLFGTSIAADKIAEVVTLMTGLLDGGTTRGSLMYQAVTYLSSADALADATYGPAAQQFANKVTVATSYTINQSGAATTISALQATIATVDATAASVTAAVANNASVAGQTFTLTTGADNFTGTSGTDTFNAGYTSANGMTFQSSDIMDGVGGTDTLNIVVGAAGTYQAQSIKNIEIINATFSAGTAVSLLGVTGVTNVTLNGSTAAGQFTNIGDATVAMKVSNTSQNADFSFTSTAVAGSADTANLTLESVGSGSTVSINGATGNFETVALTSSGSANTITALTTTNAKTLTIAGDQKLTITNGLDATITVVDASANTGGATVTMGAAVDATVTGGAGNDSLTVSAATGKVIVTGGAGNDTVTIATNLATTDTLSGGDGTDTLSTTNLLTKTAAYTTPSTRTITGFETLRLTDAADAAFKAYDIDTGITKVTFAVAGANTAANVEFNDGASTLEIGTSSTTAAALATSLTVDARNTTALSGDSLTITNKNLSTVDAFGTANIAATDFESITINSGSYTTAVVQNIGTISVTASAGYTTAETVNFAGANNIVAGVITADIIDASAMTSTTGTTLTTVTGTTAQTVTGSGGNDILIADTTAKVSISGGAGNDTITGGSSNDTLLGGDGNDSITAAGGNDSIDGGAGNDTIVMAGNYATGDVINGGDGTDTLSITSAGAATVAGYSISAITALNDALSNVERLRISDAFDVGAAFDMARVDSINYVTLAANITGAEELSGLAPSTTVVVNTAPNNAADILTLTLANATGSADALTYSMTGPAAGTDFGVLAVSGTETLNITANESTATSTVYAYTLGLNITTATAGTTVNVSGTESVTIDTVIAAQTINATGLTAGAFIMTNATGSGLSQTFTTGAGADTIYGGGGADTIDAGAGADSIVGGSGADSITGGNGADTIVGSSGNDIIILTETTPAIDNVRFDYSEGGAYSDSITGFTTGTGGDVLTIGLTALEAVSGVGGMNASATNFVSSLQANADASAGAGAIQVLTGAVAATAAKNVMILSGATFSATSEVEDALETGGSYALSISATDTDIIQYDQFLVVYTDGTNGHLAVATVTTDPSTGGVFAAGNLTIKDLATIVGITTIGSTTFVDANFAYA